MRGLAILAILATLGWCGYWVVGERALERAIVTGLAASPAVVVRDHSIRGFPNRFDVTFDAPVVQANGLTWTAPFVQVFALSYRLNHLIAVFARDQRVVGLGLDAALHSDDLRASLVMEAGLDLPLDRLTLIGQQLDLSLPGETHSADGLRAASHRSGPRVQAAVVMLEGVFPDAGVMDRADPARHWPRRFDVLRLNAEVEFDREIDRHLIDGPEPRLTRLTLTGAEIGWAGVNITATGRLTPGIDGLMSGDLALSITGWRSLMQTLSQAGMIPPEHEALIGMASLGLVSPDDTNRLEAAFSVVNGDVFLGPVLVGQIPPLVVPSF